MCEPQAKLLTSTDHTQETEANSCITMNLILLIVFVFSLDMMTLMAAKIPQHEEPKVSTMNDDALATYHVALLKRGIQKRSAGLGDCFF